MGIELTITPGKIFKFFLIIILLGAIGGGGFYAWKNGYVNQLLGSKTLEPKTNAPIEAPLTNPVQKTEEETTAPEETEQTPAETPEVPEEKPEEDASLAGSVDLEIGSVEFESKTIQPRTTTTTRNGTNTTTQTGTTSTKYKVESVTLAITNHQTEAVILKGELVVLDARGNNAVSNNFIYKTFDIPEIKAGETFNRKQPINTAGEIRPFLTGVQKGDRITVQITLKNAEGKVVKTGKKEVVVE